MKRECTWREGDWQSVNQNANKVTELNAIADLRVGTDFLSFSSSGHLILKLQPSSEAIKAKCSLLLVARMAAYISEVGCLCTSVRSLRGLVVWIKPLQYI